MNPRASSGLLFPMPSIGESDHCLRKLIHSIHAPRRAVRLGAAEPRRKAPQGEGGWILELSWNKN